MDHASNARPTRLFEVFNLGFEATETGMLRIFVLEFDPDTNFNAVIDIIKLDPSTHFFARDALAKLDRQLGSIVSMRAQWDANASRCCCDANRVRSILKAFRSKTVKIGPMRDVYVALPHEYAARA